MTTTLVSAIPLIPPALFKVQVSRCFCLLHSPCWRCTSQTIPSHQKHQLTLPSSFGAAHAHGTGDHADSETHISLPELITRTVLTVAPSAATADLTGCPTVTMTNELCSTCAVPACIIMSTLTRSCDCTDEPVPTVFLNFPCGGDGCAGAGCTTTYSIVEPEESCRPVESVTDYLDTPNIPMPTFGGNSTAVSAQSTGSTTAEPSETSGSAPPAETFSENGAGRLAVPFMGWF